MAARSAPRARRVPICRRRSATENEVRPTIPSAVTSTSRAITALSEATSMPVAAVVLVAHLGERAQYG